MVIGIGETILDIIFKDDKPSAAVPGGSSFNSMISLGRLGVPCILVTETGDDHVGDIIVRYMTDNGVSSEYVTRRKGSRSHVSLAFLDENNDASYQFYKDHAHADIDGRLPDVTADDIVIFGSFFAVNPRLRPLVRGFLEKAHAVDAVLYYDVNFRPTHIDEIPLIIDSIRENMRMSTVVRGSLEDFTYLFGCSDMEKIYGEYISPYCRHFICTDGERPLHLFTPEIHTTYPVARVEAVSTIGAGDNFNAGFVYGLYRRGNTGSAALTSMNEREWREMIRCGQDFSSHVCTSLANSISTEFAKNYRDGEEI